MTDIAPLLARLLAKVTVNSEPTPAPPCGAQPFDPTADPVEGVVYCDGVCHRTGKGQIYRGVVTGDCPVYLRQQLDDARAEEKRLKAERVSGRILAERGRLAAPIRLLERKGGPGFAGFDPTRNPAAGKALAAMKAFSAGRPPARGVYLVGETGLGKTRLFIASHFVLLTAGVDSHYVTSPQLRDLFRRSSSFDEDVAGRATEALAAIVGADAVHLDDLGDVEGDERRRGEFAQGLKRLLDEGNAVWAVATNLSLAQAEAHPDVGGKLLSRLVGDAVLVPMKGDDQRIAAGSPRK